MFKFHKVTSFASSESDEIDESTEHKISPHFYDNSLGWQIFKQE